MNFETWLKKQKNRNDPIGDLSKDYIASKDKCRLTVEYLSSKNACSGAVQALEDAKKEFNKLNSKNGKISFKWELLDEDSHGETEIAKVIGGWIIYRSEINKTMETEIQPSKDQRVISMVFIPDPCHKWEVE